MESRWTAKFISKNGTTRVLYLAADGPDSILKPMSVNLSACAFMACAVTVALVSGAACTPRQAPVSTVAAADSCLPGERGYLRVRVRGAIDADIDWRGPQLHCEGGARPEGRGLRLSFGGPPDAQGRRLRLVFGIAASPGSGASRDRPTNVTIIVEGGNQLYATQGDDKCTVESLEQQPLEDSEAGRTPGGYHVYRIAARGYCIDPAATLQGNSRLYINRFDFAGEAQFEDNELNAPDTKS